MPPLTDAYYGVDVIGRTQLIDALNSQRVFFDKRSGIFQLEANVNPFLTLLTELPSEPAAGNHVSYVDHRASFIKAHRMYLSAIDNGDLDTSGQAPGFTLADVTFHDAASSGSQDKSAQVGDIIVFIDNDDETNFLSAYVFSNTDGTYVLKTLTNACGFDLNKTGGTRSVALIAGNIFGEGSDEAPKRYEKPVTRWFTTQSFKRGFEITDEALATKQITYGEEFAFQSDQSMAALKSEVDKTALYSGNRIVGPPYTNPFAAPDESVIPLDADGNKMYSTMSLYQVLKATGLTDPSAFSISDSRIFKLTAATATYDDLIEAAQEQFRYGNDTKYCFCGAGFLTKLDILCQSFAQWNITSGEEKFGLNWMRLLTKHGEFMLHRHKGMNDDHLTNAMFVLDTQFIKRRDLIPLYMEKLTTNATKKSYEWRWNCGLQVWFPEAHGLWWLS
jgi:hypothetical protein